MIRRKMQTIMLAIFCLCLPALSASGQWQQLKYIPYLQGASLRIKSPVLSYRYVVTLVDGQGKHAVDSIGGVLVKSYGNFKDSNKNGVTMVADGYYLKIDKHNRRTSVYNIAAVQKKTGLKAEDMGNELFSLPDSLLNKYSDLTAQELPDVLVLTYTMKESEGLLKEMQFRINRKDMSLLSLKMTFDEQDRWGSSSGYSKVYYMDKFRNNVGAGEIDLKQYLILKEGKAKLKEGYSSYPINSIL